MTEENKLFRLVADGLLEDQEVFCGGSVKDMKCALEMMFRTWDNLSDSVKEYLTMHDYAIKGDPAMSIQEYDRSTGRTTVLFTLKDALGENCGMSAYRESLSKALLELCRGASFAD